MFRAVKSLDRLNSDPGYQRRLFILLAGVYVVSMVVGVNAVIREDQPVWSLVGLPIPVLMAYFLLRTASRTKVPPQESLRQVLINAVTGEVGTRSNMSG